MSTNLVPYDYLQVPSDEQLKRCADHVLNIEKIGDPQERLEEIKSLTDNRGTDLVAECAGVPEAVPQGLDMLRVGGTLIVAGNYIDTGPIPVNPQKQILSKNARIIGVSGQTAASYAGSLRLRDSCEAFRSIRW